jgi:hypothetical protein
MMINKNGSAGQVVDAGHYDAQGKDPFTNMICLERRTVARNRKQKLS